MYFNFSNNILNSRIQYIIRKINRLSVSERDQFLLNKLPKEVCLITVNNLWLGMP